MINSRHTLIKTVRPCLAIAFIWMLQSKSDGEYSILTLSLPITGLFLLNAWRDLMKLREIDLHSRILHAVHHPLKRGALYLAVWASVLLPLSAALLSSGEDSSLPQRLCFLWLLSQVDNLGSAFVEIILEQFNVDLVMRGTQDPETVLKVNTMIIKQRRTMRSRIEEKA